MGIYKFSYYYNFRYFFVLVQFKEYSDSIFSFNDSCYGSVFFLLTGFHGFHVIIGLIFLLICCYRLYLTYKFNFYELNKNLYLKKLFKVFFFEKYLFKIITKNRYKHLVTTTSEKSYIFEDFLEDLIKHNFNDLMHMITCSSIYDSMYNDKSKLKKKKQFLCQKKISFKQVTTEKIQLSIKDTYYVSSLKNYCNIQKKEILFFFYFFKFN